MSTAAEVIDRLETVRPDVVKLARVASLAARLEPALLRRFRLKFLPRSDAGLEADLRFSPLTRSHNASSIILRTEVVELLREQLAELDNPPLLDLAWEILEPGHQSAPSVIQLEEKVTWLALCGEVTAGELEAELKRAVHAMTQEDRPGIAQWAARALPRLPAKARQTEAACLLAMGAAARLGGREILDQRPAVDVSPELLRAVLPRETQTAQIGVRLLADGIEFGDLRLPGAKLLSVPNTSPVTVDLLWSLENPPDLLWGLENAPQEKLPAHVVFSLGSGKKVTPPVANKASYGIQEIQISTFLGEQHTLRPVPPRVFISYSHDTREQCDRVLMLAQQLRHDGIDAELDQFHQDKLLHWPRWCEERLRPENSDWVLCICTPEYKRRVEGRVAADVG